MNILITAGPTREPLDPVRFISNRSSGKMGYAVAAQAVMRGHSVRLVSGPVHLTPPSEAALVSVETAAEMLMAVEDNLAWCEALIMVAAVADWRPRNVADQKLKKATDMTEIALEQTRDILAHVAPRKGSRRIIGFAAETENLVVEATRKLEEKAMDLIVANDITEADSGFESDTNRVAFITPGGRVEALSLMSKVDVADRIIDWLEKGGAS